MAHKLYLFLRDSKEYSLQLQNVSRILASRICRQIYSFIKLMISKLKCITLEKIVSGNLLTPYRPTRMTKIITQIPFDRPLGGISQKQMEFDRGSGFQLDPFGRNWSTLVGIVSGSGRKSRQ